MGNNYGFGKTVSYSFEIALDKVKQELHKEGFGILSVIDVAATLKKGSILTCHPIKFLELAIHSWLKEL